MTIPQIILDGGGRLTLGSVPSGCGRRGGGASLSRPACPEEPPSKLNLPETGRRVDRHPTQEETQ